MRQIPIPPPGELLPFKVPAAQRVDTRTGFSHACLALFITGQLATAPSATAGCETSSDGLTRTCTGAITSAESFNHDNETSSKTYDFIFKALTSSEMKGSSGPTLQFDSTGKTPGGSSAGVSASALSLDVNTDATVSGFNINSTSAPSVQMQSTGGNGGSHGENKGSGHRSGGDGATGGIGGKLTMTMSDASIAASPGKPFTVISRGGTGGHGRENYSTGFGDGLGGNGGQGGHGSAIQLTLKGVKVSNLSNGNAPVMNILSIGGNSGNGGEGKSADYTSRGGVGGTGPHGGSIGVALTGGLTIDGGNATGITMTSQGGAGGNGGEGYNTLSNDGHGNTGGTGGAGGNLSFTSTDSGAIAINATGDGALLMRSLASDGGTGGHGGSDSGEGLGGDGGQGGTGGNVTITLPNSPLQITTHGDAAQGIFAHSWGGGGGDGGSGSSTFNKGKGGSAAGSGPGGNIAVTLSGDIATDGNQSNAMLIHSVGGFSGQGGSGSGFTAYGGSSESSGPGGTVNVTWLNSAGSNSTIQTKGKNSDAIFVQSQGGGGGKGGSGDGLKGVGGSGSAGGNGMAVIVNTSGHAITTTAEYSRGIYAQSTGGGGGDGGGSRSINAIGGSGSKGGSGSTVNVTNSSTITTGGEGSTGLFAQSIGGGGGSALSSSGISAIGGSGGGGGSAGTVTVANTGDITTSGSHAPALLAQGVGLGGGHGGSTAAIGVGFSHAVGGKGGSAGHGGDIIVQETTSTPMLTTSDDHSQGFMAQSVGGGGGHGGSAISISASPNIDVGISLSGSGASAGNGGTVDVAFNGGISTGGDHSIGLMATSTGGAGGSAGTSLSLGGGVGTVNIALGGSSGGGGSGKHVNVCRGQFQDTSGATCGAATAVDALSITTTGDIAHGILVASGGGGGGHSGATIAGSAISWSSVNVSAGGSGGTGGDGHNAVVYSSGGITTSGNHSYGILAKSYGGTGGAAFASIAGSTSTSGDVGVSIGGKGGAAGQADLASVTSRDTILTQGTNADGIAALSVAGSGGAGGVSVAGNTVSGSNIGIAIGGKGGGGAASGKVLVDYLGVSIETKGTQSVGIQAASVAGSGGRGGLDVDGALASVGSVEVAVGGAGGNGGTAGTATVTNQSGIITTHGTQAPAISASSHGGAGGRGGASISSTAASEGSANITVGGGGGNGGTSDVVTVTNGGTLLTKATHSQGIFAQSHGGSGGAGGFVVEGGINVGGEDGAPAGNVSVSVGGSGGTGGISGAVNVFNTGNITAEEYKSDGLFAQSIGGQGGSGGTVWSGEANVKSEVTVDIDVSVGGSGGAGGASAPVGVTNGAVITTKAPQSHAVFAQSVGGNGGVGGSSYNILLNIQTTAESKNSAQITVGGSGGKGAKAATVMVSNSGSLVTDGGGSDGIYAQSIGGNGGAGGSAGNVLVNAGKAPAGKSTVQRSVQVDVGGAGGTGAHSNTVSVTNQGSITTNAQSSDAIFAQSVGGGGGDGGSASGYMLNVTGKCSFITGIASYSCTQPNGNTTNVTRSFTLNVGGKGGAGGNGDTVTVKNTGAIATHNTASHGIFAHSIGGGGGTGGSASDNLAAFTSSPIATAITNVIRGATANPYNLLKNYTSYQLSIGGKGGAAGNGEAVDITNTKTIATHGESSYGVHAQSIGGGGGEGGKASASFVYSLSVGGLGSGGGNGGMVTVDNSAAGAEISTTGENSIGIFAQSVGDGGGAGGDVGVILGVKWGVLKVGVGVGAKTADGKGGDGGDITIKTGDVTTTGKLAHGLFAHTVGGSGGALGYVDENNTPQGWAGNAKDDGAAGNVTITVDGQIDVSGEQSHGIFAQSAAGESASVSTNTAGKVTIDVIGGVSATGSGARAILAQSEGGAKNGQVAITVEEGATATSGLSSDATIGILEGMGNMLTNHGTISKPEGSAVTGYTVRTKGGQVTINNDGTLSGSLSLEPGSAYKNTFNNLAGGLFEPGLEVNLGSGGTLSNDAVISPGGKGGIVTSAVTGTLTQSSSGQYAVDVVPASNGGDPAQVDMITVTKTADLAGTVKANIEVTNSSATGEQTTPAIVKASGGISADTKTNLTIVPSVAADYKLIYPSAGEIAISYNIDWSSPTILGATRDNHDSMARHIQAMFVTGQLDPLVADALIGIETVAEYADFADTISPEIYANNQLSTLYSSLGFADSLMSCAVSGGAYKFVRQGQCGWFRAGVGRLDQDENSRSVGFNESSWVIAGGAQFDVGNDWSVGMGLSYENKDLNQYNEAQSNGEQYQLGVVGKRRFDATMLSASLSGGYGTYSLERRLPDGAGNGDQDLWNVAGQFRAAYTFAGDSWFVTPRADVGIDWVATDDIAEEEGGFFGASLEGSSETYYHVQPAVEGGGDIALANESVLRMSLELGITQFLGDAAPSVNGRFVTSSTDVEGFEVESEFDKTYLDLAARVEWLNRKNLSLSLTGYSSTSQNTQRYGGEFKMAIPF